MRTKILKINFVKRHTILFAVFFLLSGALNYVMSIRGSHPADWKVIGKFACVDSFMLVFIIFQINGKIYKFLDNKENIFTESAARKSGVLIGLLILLFFVFNQYYQAYSFFHGSTPFGYTIDSILRYSFVAMLVAGAIVLGLQQGTGSTQKAGLLIGYLIFAGIFSLILKFINTNLLAFYVLVCMLMVNFNYFIGNINYKRFSKGPESGEAFREYWLGFINSVFYTLEQLENIAFFLVLMISLIAVPIVLLLQGVAWWMIIVETILFVLGNLIFCFFLIKYHKMELGDRLVYFILQIVPADHKDYEQFYVIYISYECQKRFVDFYNYLLRILPMPTFAAKGNAHLQVKRIPPAGPPPPPVRPQPPLVAVDAAKPEIAAPQPVLKKEKKTPLATEQKLFADLKGKKNIIKEIYDEDINHVSSELGIGLSILIKCDKIISEYLWTAIIEKAGIKYELLDVFDTEAGNYTLVADQLKMLRSRIKNIDQNTILVIPHLDLLAGGSSSYLGDAGRELTQLLYSNGEAVILAFTDITFAIPEILSSRFSISRVIGGIPKILYKDGTSYPTVDLMLTRGELSYFQNFNADEIYRVISGMNPIKIRQAISYAINERPNDGLISMEQLKDAIRVFKAKTSANFVVPDISFADIGGYEDVKAQLNEAIQLIKGHNLTIDDALREELIPKGFLFYGPPGTGKTVFAKAVANKLMANVMVVSGPEIVDMYVGESERKVREIFAEARRNAPSVLVFDEFDSIASNRSKSNSSGQNLYNGVVAQILTEMDGFRPDVPVLVIGTTNRLDIIDEALLRPSRFKAVGIDLPDKEARRAIIEIYSNKFGIPVSAQLMDGLSESAAGFNGDEIKFIFKQIAMELKVKKSLEGSIPRKIGEIVGKMRHLKENESISINKRSAAEAGRRMFIISG